MPAGNQTVATLVGGGGTAPYTFQVVSDSETTIAASISGNQLTVDATSVIPGNYSVHARVVDSGGRTADLIIPVTAADSSVFTILTTDTSYQPSSFPLNVSIPLRSSGGVGTVVYSLISGVTTAPYAAISGGNFTATVGSFDDWAVGITATDALGNQVNKIITLAIESAQVFAMVDGQVEVLINVPTTNLGTHNFTLTAVDNTGTNSIRKTFNYVAAEEVTAIDTSLSFVDYEWGDGDTTTIVLPILGDLTGFSLGSSGTILASNGIAVTIDTTNQTMAFSGPPTSYGNAEIFVPIGILKGSNQVATVTREFTLLSHSGTTDIGNATCNTMPYAVGQLIGLNPMKPFFNSLHYSKPSTYIVSVATGQVLPPGLSLDANTGLIYGTISGTGVNQSVLNYTDAAGILHGTVTINWDIQVSAFTLTDNTTVGQIQVAYSGSFTNSAATKLSTASVYRGRLPQGLSLSVNGAGTNVTIAGTPIESGIFDIWLKVTNQASQSALIYKRFAVSYLRPLVIVTDSLPQILTGLSYATFLIGFGGVAPYTWSISSGSLPTGITLNSTTGELSGTTSVSVYSQTLSFTLTDSRGVSTSASLLLAIDNTLAIETTSLPLITPSQPYSYRLLATGGSPAYTWSLASGSPALPGGLTLSSAGLLSGATSVEDYTENILVKVTDTVNTSVTQLLTLQVGVTASILVDTSGVGPIARGGSYHGLIRVYGSGVAPYTWSVASDTPNALPTGIFLSGDISTQGATATLSGLTDAVFSNLSVKIQVLDVNGNYAVAYLLLNSYSSLTITTPSLPQGIVSGNYSVQLAASGYNPAFTWTLDGTSAALPAGYSLSNSGLLSGVTGTTYSGTIVVDVTDALGDTASKSYSLSVQQSTLADTTTSLPNVNAGQAYTATLTASGGTPAYVWALSPASPTLPSGLALNSSTGVISGVTTSSGYSETLVVRLSDATGFYVDKSLVLVVNSALALHTGVDYTDSLNTLYLGYETNGDVTSINPRPNLSFYVVATGVLSTDITQPTVNVPEGFTATVKSIVGGVALVQLSGPFNAGAVGDNSFQVSFVDVGVTVTSVFKWLVLATNVVRLAPSSGSIPIQYLD